MASLIEHEHRRHPISQFEDVGALRRMVADLAARNPRLRKGEAELVATELGTNLLKHAAGGGYVLFRPTGEGIELISVDTGPGMSQCAVPAEAAPMSLGATGLSAGLASIQRMTSEYECYSDPSGTVVLARLGGERPRDTERWRFGGINVPLGGEGASGDTWAVTVDSMVAAVVVDGLGHGEEAGYAARAAADVFLQRPVTDPVEFLGRAHEVMRGTRGGVAGVCVIDPDAGQLAFAGAGNINGQIIRGDEKQYLASTPGTLGTQLTAPRVRAANYRWSRGSTLLMYSDGIRTGLGFSAYPGLQRHHPAVIGGVFHRDFTRLTDDATVLVLRDMS